MTATQRRAAVREAMAAAQMSERRACRWTGFPRSTQRYQPTRDDRELQARLESLAILKPRWGYRRLHWLLAREGTHVNRKRLQRVYRAAGLHVRRRRRKRVSVIRVPTAAPTRANERWSMDFVSDTLGSGQVFRTFTLVDDCSRESPGLLVDCSLSAARLTRFLDELPVRPTVLVCDNALPSESRESEKRVLAQAHAGCASGRETTGATTEPTAPTELPPNTSPPLTIINTASATRSVAVLAALHIA